MAGSAKPASPFAARPVVLRFGVFGLGVNARLALQARSLASFFERQAA